MGGKKWGGYCLVYPCLNKKLHTQIGGRDSDKKIVRRESDEKILTVKI